MGSSNCRRDLWLAATGTASSEVSSVTEKKTVPTVLTKTPAVSIDKFKLFLNYILRYKFQTSLNTQQSYCSNKMYIEMQSNSTNI